MLSKGGKEATRQHTPGALECPTIGFAPWLPLYRVVLEFCWNRLVFSLAAGSMRSRMGSVP